MTADTDFDHDDQRDHALIEALRELGIAISFADGALVLESGRVRGVYSSRVFCPVVALPGVPDGLIHVRRAAVGRWEMRIRGERFDFSEEELGEGPRVPK